MASANRMKPTVRVALIFVACYMAVKIGVFAAGVQHEDIGSILPIFGNMLFILLAVFFGLRVAKKEDAGKPTIFLHDMKMAMQSAVTYTLLIGIFSYCYYRFIDVDFMNVKIDEFMANGEGFDAATLSPEQNPQGFTTEEIIEKERDAAAGFYNSAMQSSLTTLGTFLLGGLYSLIVVLFYRKVLTRFE